MFSVDAVVISILKEEENAIGEMLQDKIWKRVMKPDAGYYSRELLSDPVSHSFLCSDSRLFKGSNSSRKSPGTEAKKEKCGHECWHAEEEAC